MSNDKIIIGIRDWFVPFSFNHWLSSIHQFILIIGSCFFSLLHEIFQRNFHFFILVFFDKHVIFQERDRVRHIISVLFFSADVNISHDEHDVFVLPWLYSFIRPFSGKFDLFDEFFVVICAFLILLLLVRVIDVRHLPCFCVVVTSILFVLLHLSFVAICFCFLVFHELHECFRFILFLQHFVPLLLKPCFFFFVGFLPSLLD